MTRLLTLLMIVLVGVWLPNRAWAQGREGARRAEGDEVKAWHRQRVKMLQQSAGTENLSLVNYQSYQRFKAQIEQEQRLSGITGYTPLNGSWAQLNLQVSEMGMGRINCMAVSPTNPQLIYVGTPTGGLWRTMDGGNTWSELTRAIQVPGISGICIDPINTQVIYILTGSASSVECQSLGVFKTTDGGINWYATGFSVDFTPNWFYSSVAINAHELIMHPTNSLILLAATTQGLYRTADGGISWTVVAGGDVPDVEFHPTDPNMVYISRVNGSVQISNDGGLTFSPAAAVRFFGTAGTSFGACTMAVTPAAPDSLFFVLSKEERISGIGLDTLEIVATRVDKTNRILLGGRRIPSMTFSGNPLFANYVCSALRWYRDGRLAISPTTTRDMYIGGLWVYSSNNYGNSFTNKAFSANDSLMVHSDCTFVGYINGQVYTTNDGGIYRQTPSPTQPNALWTNLTSAMPIAQIFRIGASQTTTTKFALALQDNGIHLLDNTQYDLKEWGDGVMARMSHTDDNVFYCRTNGFRTIRYTGNQRVDISPNSQVGSTFIPFEVDRQNADRLYTATDSLFISNNKGDAWSRFPIGVNNNIKLMAVSPTNNQVIWLLEDFSVNPTTGDTTHARLWRTSSGGTSFALVALPVGMPVDFISSVTISEQDNNVVYLTFDGYYSGYKVWRTANASQVPASLVVWSNWGSEQLPNLPVNCLLNQATADDKLYVGTDIGVFHRTNSLGRWIPFMNGMPLCRVTELMLNRTDNQMLCATYGRGVFRSDLYSGVCASVLNLSGTQSGNQIFSAGTTLNSTATLQGGQASQIRYYSAADLFLNPGFQSGYGTPLLATIAPCGGVVNSFLRHAPAIDGFKDSTARIAPLTIQPDTLRSAQLRVDSVKAGALPQQAAPYRFDLPEKKSSEPIMPTSAKPEAMLGNKKASDLR